MSETRSSTSCPPSGGSAYGGLATSRSNRAHIAHTIQTYQHLLPGMGVEAARNFERLAGPVPTAGPDTVERRGNNGRNTA